MTAGPIPISWCSTSARSGRSVRFATSSSARTANASAPNATDDLLIGLQLTHSGRYLAAEPIRSRRATRRVRAPDLDRRFAARRPVLEDERARSAGRRIRCARHASHSRIGFAFVDIKHCHGYLGHELLSGYAASRTLRRDVRQPHPLPAATSSKASAPRRRDSRSACGCRLSTTVPYPQERRWHRRAGGRGRRLRACVRTADERRRATMRRSTMRARCFGLLTRSAHPAGCASRPGQPVLQPAYAAAGALSAKRRLRAARGPAARCRAPYRGDGAIEARVSRISVFVGSGYTLPAGMAAARRAARRPHRQTDFVGLGSHGAGVSRLAGRRAGRTTARAQDGVSDVQRLHDRSTARPRVGLLSARS